MRLRNAMSLDGYDLTESVFLGKRGGVILAIDQKDDRRAQSSSQVQFLMSNHSNSAEHSQTGLCQG